MGIDLSMQSCTKYLNGHSDVTGGVLSGSRALLAPIAKTRRLLGGVMDPLPAFALGRGMKTMPLRVAQHNANALTVAQFLEGHPQIERVYYPGLASHPDHAIASAADDAASAAWSRSTSRAARRRVPDLRPA